MAPMLVVDDDDDEDDDEQLIDLCRQVRSLFRRIKYALSNEIYFLLLGSIIMLKSIFNILGSIEREVFCFASVLSVFQRMMCNGERQRKEAVV